MQPFLISSPFVLFFFFVSSPFPFFSNLDYFFLQYRNYAQGKWKQQTQTENKILKFSLHNKNKAHAEVHSALQGKSNLGCVLNVTPSCLWWLNVVPWRHWSYTPTPHWQLDGWRFTTKGICFTFCGWCHCVWNKTSSCGINIAHR